MDYRLEVVVVPVSDVDRARAFYSEQAGVNVDHDASPSPEVRVVQLTPPGSACSWRRGERDQGDGPPGPARTRSPIALHVADVAAARVELESRGVEFIHAFDSGVCHNAFFQDPDGNAFLLHHRYAPKGADD